MTPWAGTASGAAAAAAAKREAMAKAAMARARTAQLMPAGGHLLRGAGVRGACTVFPAAPCMRAWACTRHWAGAGDGAGGCRGALPVTREGRAELLAAAAARRARDRVACGTSEAAPSHGEGGDGDGGGGGGARGEDGGAEDLGGPPLEVIELDDAGREMRRVVRATTPPRGGGVRGGGAGDVIDLTDD